MKYDFLLKKCVSRLRMCEIFTTVEDTDLALKKGSPTSKLRSRNAAHTTDTHTFFENMAVPPHWATTYTLSWSKLPASA